MRTSRSPQTARQRLAEISHHFLSESGETAGDVEAIGQATDSVAASPDRRTLTFAIITGMTDNDFPLFQLCKQLTAHGWSTAIIDERDDPRALSFISRQCSNACITVHQGATVHDIEEITRREENTIHDAHFRILNASMHEQLTSAHKILLPVQHADCESKMVKEKIAKLCLSNDDAGINVIVMGAPDKRLADIAFRRLDSHTRFIHDQALHSLGHLPLLPAYARRLKSYDEMNTLTERISESIRERGIL